MNEIYLMRQLYNLKMKDNVSIHGHLNMFNSLVSKFVISPKKEKFVSHSIPIGVRSNVLIRIYLESFFNR